MRTAVARVGVARIAGVGRLAPEGGRTAGVGAYRALRGVLGRP
jgi:hypothetical protein